MRGHSVIMVAVVIATAATSAGRTAAAQRARPDDTTRRRVIMRDDGPRRRPSREPATRRGRLGEATTGEITTAYRDARSRGLIARARSARFQQDSTLTSYDATVKQRLSAGLNVKAIGTDRLVFRSELAARIRWTASNRVLVDVLGARTVVPLSFPGAKVLTGAAELVPVPYFTGSDRLMWWFNFGEGDEDDDDTPFSYVNPLERGAEAVYEYRSGDSALIQLPGAKAITLQEVIVRAREASADLIVGSLWFESDGGQLVRAAFRPAAPMNMMKIIGEDSFDDVPAPVRAMMTPFTFEVEMFTIDYGLYGGRWWLPRSQTAKGEVRMGFMRSTGTIDQSFRYASVNGTDTLPQTPAGRGRLRSDFGDDVSLIVKGAVDGVVPGNQFRRDEEDSRLDCAKGDTLVRRRRDNNLRMTINMPCDTVALLRSPELPPSIFDKGEEHFGIADARALAKDLGIDKELAAVSGSSSARTTTVSYGWRNGLLRYNRVEGLSLAGRVERPLGRGYVGSTVVRFGTGDLEPNIDARVTRGAVQRSVSFGGYHRLESANDWGDPFGLGGSISSLVFGRDEGFYYRSSGADLTGVRLASAATSVTWRLFAERQHNAPIETQLSLPNAFRGAEFEPNVKAIAATEGGAAARLRGSHGLDPRGLRLSADLRAEAAAGTFDYTRGALDVTASRYLVGNLALALNGGAGTSGGTLSPQRAWHIGGTNTVRGFRPGTLSGDSYWLARAELGLGGSVVRPTVFYDAGWAGSRSDWSESRGNVRGAGMGVSFLEGLVRVDLARGVDPKTVWRAHLYVEATF